MLGLWRVCVQFGGVGGVVCRPIRGVFVGWCSAIACSQLDTRGTAVVNLVLRVCSQRILQQAVEYVLFALRSSVTWGREVLCLSRKVTSE